MEKQYTINEVAVMSGLTTRTLRNYMKMGILKGEMVEGVWKFTEEEIGAFFCKEISKRKEEKIKFSFERNGVHARVILSGYEDVVMEILNAYYHLG